MPKHTIPLLLVVLISIMAVFPAPARADDNMPPYFSVRTVELEDGALVEEMIIAGPPNPPPGYERASVTPPAPQAAPGFDAAAESNVLPVPAYRWTFGCSATSAAMIAAYYDRTGFPNIYTGPTDGGVMPPDSSVWGTWPDKSGDQYAQCPLAASRLGLDGRDASGSIDDYWFAYGSTVADPYITGGWTQHTWGDAIGDYMKTSQSAYDNSDGSTVFWTRATSGPLTCDDMKSNAEVVRRDGTYGQKLFYEARGYTVAECYSQQTDNVIAGGFTFAQYKAEIDAGHPVMLNLEGHTVVGAGYDDASNTVYLYDTWDYALHTMTWGGSYAGEPPMPMHSVSIVHPVRIVLPAVDDLAAGFTDEGRLELAWSEIPGASGYEVWHAVDDPYFAPGDDCDHPGILGCTEVDIPGLTLDLPAASTTYAVRAVNNVAAPSLSTGRVGVFVYGLAPGG